MKVIRITSLIFRLRPAQRGFKLEAPHLAILEKIHRFKTGGPPGDLSPPDFIETNGGKSPLVSIRGKGKANKKGERIYRNLP